MSGIARCVTNKRSNFTNLNSQRKFVVVNITPWATNFLCEISIISHYWLLLVISLFLHKCKLIVPDWVLWRLPRCFEIIRRLCLNYSTKCYTFRTYCLAVSHFVYCLYLQNLQYLSIDKKMGNHHLFVWDYAYHLDVNQLPICSIQLSIYQRLL